MAVVPCTLLNAINISFSMKNTEKIMMVGNKKKGNQNRIKLILDKIAVTRGEIILDIAYE